MKVANPIRNIYYELRGDYERLSDEVRTWLEVNVEKHGWFFIHRLKELESYALKVETGRVSDPANMEEFFACTVIVPLASEISKAESFLSGRYMLVERRPRDDQTTTKRAYSFVFDDLRLYLRLRPSETGRNKDLERFVFEVQVKTILQHAWSIATHDLIYKTDSVSWPKERIAFQVKAMLEHTELAIAEAERLAESPSISRRDSSTAKTLDVIASVREFWPAERLPGDMRRLAGTIQNLLDLCGIAASKLEGILLHEKKRIGILPTNLSPYAFIVQALANSPQIDFRQVLSKPTSRTKVLIHEDMDLPDWMKGSHNKIICI